MTCKASHWEKSRSVFPEGLGLSKQQDCLCHNGLYLSTLPNVVASLAFCLPYHSSDQGRDSNFSMFPYTALGTHIQLRWQLSFLPDKCHSSPCLALVLGLSFPWNLLAQCVRRGPGQSKTPPTGPCPSQRWPELKLTEHLPCSRLSVENAEKFSCIASLNPQNNSIRGVP